VLVFWLSEHFPGTMIFPEHPGMVFTDWKC
jgi:hypothetical protein